MNFKQYVKIFEQNTVGTHNDYATGAFVPSVSSGTETYSNTLPHLSSIDLVMPNVAKTSFISYIELNKNPILILLKDGTKIFLNIDQYNRIKPTPEIGKRITVVFQRSPEDKSNEPSKIEKIEIN